MRLYPIGLIPLFLATTAHSQTLDNGQGGWDLRRSDLALSDPVRLRPGSDPGLLTQQGGTLPAVVAAPFAEPYKGYSVLGGTFSMGTGLGTYFDDNVFAATQRKRSDIVVVARPEFAWITSGQGYAVGVDGYVEGKRNNTYSSEDQQNGGVGANFKVMPDADTQFIGAARYVHGHLDRGTSETIGPSGVVLSTVFNEPISYDQVVGAFTVNKRFNTWWTSVGVTGVNMKFQDPTISGLADVSLNYADGRVGTVNGRLGHVIAPLTSVFVEVAANKRNWGVSDFNSQGYRTAAGMLLDPGPNARVRGEVWAGYMNQNYVGQSFQTVSTFTYGGALTVSLTDQLSAVVEGRREAKEAALSVGILTPGTIGVNDSICSGLGASCVSAIQSQVSGRLDYRIRPNLVVGAGVSYLQDRYLGVEAGNRTDQTISPVASIKFAPTDRATLGFDYRRINFDPSGGESVGVAAPSYSRNVYLVSLAGKF